MKQTMAGALCVWAILAAGCGERAEPLAPAPASAEPSVRSEQAEPLGNWADFRFETTAGKPVSLGDYKGKTLLVDVWSYTWHVCIEEWPLVKDLQRKYGFEVLLWSVDASYGSEEEARKSCARAIDMHKISWPNVIVPGGWDKLKKDYNIDGYGLFLIDGDGRLLGRELFPDDIEDILKARGN